MSEAPPIPALEELLETARAHTGLSDFGQPTFREGLARFLQSMEEDADLTPEGVDQLVGTIVGRLCNRLQIEDWYRHHPEIEQLTVERPLFITGMPRTGTSALANILSIEPSFRCMRVWEQEPACPPPVLETEHDDPRRLAFKRHIEEMAMNNPEELAMHLHELDSATEDPMLIGMEFKTQNCTAPVFGYHAWWRDCDMRPTYAYQRRAVKLLQSRRPPNRWLFKAPHYVFHLDAVVAAYPDARFLITHRDPVKSLPSCVSYTLSHYPPGSLDRLGVKRLGAHFAAHHAIGLRRMIEARERLGQHRFHDISHHAFVSDPIGTVERVYAFAGLTLTPNTRDRMTEWARENRPGAHGKHRYTADQFGLDRDGIRAQYAFYTDQYDVSLE